MGESTVASEGPELRREELHIADRQAYLEAGLINDNGGSMRRAGGCGLGALVCGWYKKIRMLARCAVSSAT